MKFTPHLSQPPNASLTLIQPPPKCGLIDMQELRCHVLHLIAQNRSIIIMQGGGTISQGVGGEERYTPSNIAQDQCHAIAHAQYRPSKAFFSLFSAVPGMAAFTFSNTWPSLDWPPSS
ncbi:hypothetical protein F751_3923 [Auxenochlorella protothecoides]|uniref:Uncharacterized protein n=1 Tax=Auxenochlorella protothecoides TaxID=3075 RepID=A0A087SHN9_AUXPR|nr:hypothetical protein F751_3923 [Auxenochlorella protothecoides]KFM25243.1 hypothetical protein F751_3923 [Auxenochlorella protothecoides]